MTAKRVAQLKSHWPLILILSAIFLSGWRANADVTERVRSEVREAEKRITEQRDKDLGLMRADISRIRELLEAALLKVPK